MVAIRSEDETEIRAGEAASGSRDQGHSARDAPAFSAEEMIRVVLEGLRREELCRLGGIATSMYYG